jgi:hypothetical protein
MGDERNTREQASRDDLSQDRLLRLIGRKGTAEPEAGAR